MLIELDRKVAGSSVKQRIVVAAEGIAMIVEGVEGDPYCADTHIFLSSGAHIDVDIGYDALIEKLNLGVDRLPK